MSWQWYTHIVDIILREQLISFWFQVFQQKKFNSDLDVYIIVQPSPHKYQKECGIENLWQAMASCPLKSACKYLLKSTLHT